MSRPDERWQDQLRSISTRFEWTMECTHVVSELFAQVKTDPAGTDTVVATGRKRRPRTTTPPPSQDPVLVQDALERYDDQGPIGMGAMGEVRRVWDPKLERSLALKILLPEHLGKHDIARRFLREARITAGLQHPGIVSVHDLGINPDGRVWFTMKEVRGRTLREVINELHDASQGKGWERSPNGWTLRRLVDVFGRTCETMAYAHGHGVIHRDLKPDNIMVGAFGEVQVMDWGLGKLLSVSDAEEPDTEAVDPPSIPSDPPSHATLMGAVMGTPAYMSPEQAIGAAAGADARADVYALGSIFYEILSGQPPLIGHANEVWEQLVQGPPPPLHENHRDGSPDPPEDLVPLVERAMARDRKDRYRDAGILGREVDAWLEGARREERALEIVSEAEALQPRISRLREEAASLRHRANALLAEVRPEDPEERKLPGWALEDEAAELIRRATLEEARFEQTLRGALDIAPELARAHAHLAQLYRRRVEDAEARRDLDAAARYEVMTRAHDRGTHAAWLQGDGAVSLLTEPPGIPVRLFTYELENRRLVPRGQKYLGTTPLSEVVLPRGSHVLELRPDDRPTIRYPVAIGRLEHWDGVPPGAHSPAPLPVPTANELRRNECYVPAGWFRSGGDPDAPDGLPARRVWLDGFVAQRVPVSNADYLEFLNDLLVQSREEEALRYAPREGRGASGDKDGDLVYARDPEGRFALSRDAAGRTWEPTWPVALVDWHSANAYATWLAAQQDLPWRLPHDLEWEKAARGVDGRFWPWGDFLERTWACVLQCRPGPPRPAGIDEFPRDESPYGLRGAAGNVREWCQNAYTREGLPAGATRIDPTQPPDAELKLVRGGAWTSTSNLCRLAARLAAKPDDRLAGLGFRLVRSI